MENLTPGQNLNLRALKELRDELYVDDLMMGDATVEEVEVKKATATTVFKDATFELHKWHSNAEELETVTHIRGMKS